MSKWYIQDTVKTKTAANRMAAFHRKQGFHVKIKEGISLSSKSPNKIIRKKQYEVWIATK